MGAVPSSWMRTQQHECVFLRSRLERSPTGSSLASFRHCQNMGGESPAVRRMSCQGRYRGQNLALRAGSIALITAVCKPVWPGVACAAQDRLRRSRQARRLRVRFVAVDELSGAVVVSWFVWDVASTNDANLTMVRKGGPAKGLMAPLLLQTEAWTLELLEPLQAGQLLDFEVCVH